MNEATSKKSWIELADDEIDLSDIPELDGDFAEQATMCEPLVRKNTMLVDSDIYEWFQREGPDYQQRMNRLLRDYMDSRKNCG